MDSKKSENFNSEPKNKYSLSKTDILVKEFAYTLGVSDWVIKERMRFFNYQFNLSSEEFFATLDKNKFLVLNPIEQFIYAKELLAAPPLNFSRDNIHSFVLQTNNFPCITKSIDTIREKIVTLQSLGVTVDDISKNFEILRKNKKEIELRTKLAFINNLPLDSFTYNGHFVNSPLVWSRMNAVERNMTDYKKIYNTIYFNKYCKYTQDELVQMFPLDEKAIAFINQRYESLRKSGKTWRVSYKASERYSNDPQNSFCPRSSFDTALDEDEPNQ